MWDNLIKCVLLLSTTLEGMLHVWNYSQLRRSSEKGRRGKITQSWKIWKLTCIGIMTRAGRYWALTRGQALFQRPMYYFFKVFIYLFSERGEGSETEWERSVSVWLPLGCPAMGTWPTSQACALTGNRTGKSLSRRPALSPLSHTSQGWRPTYFNSFNLHNKPLRGMQLVTPCRKPL